MNEPKRMWCSKCKSHQAAIGGQLACRHKTPGYAALNCEAPGCGILLPPERDPRTKFCSGRCKQRAHRERQT